MRVLVHGPVTDDHLQTAEEFYGIVPTSFVTNDHNDPPHTRVPHWQMPIDRNLGILGERARNYTLVQNCDAAIIIGANEHLAGIVRKYGLPLFEDVS